MKYTKCDKCDKICDTNSYYTVSVLDIHLCTECDDKLTDLWHEEHFESERPEHEKIKLYDFYLYSCLICKFNHEKLINVIKSFDKEELLSIISSKLTKANEFNFH